MYRSTILKKCLGRFVNLGHNIPKKCTIGYCGIDLISPVILITKAPNHAPICPHTSPYHDGFMISRTLQYLIMLILLPRVHPSPFSHFSLPNLYGALIRPPNIDPVLHPPSSMPSFIILTFPRVFSCQMDPPTA